MLPAYQKFAGAHPDVVLFVDDVIGVAGVFVKETGNTTELLSEYPPCQTPTITQFPFAFPAEFKPTSNVIVVRVKAVHPI